MFRGAMHFGRNLGASHKYNHVLPVLLAHDPLSSYYILDLFAVGLCVFIITK